MTFETERAKIGRTLIWRVDMDLDYCQNTYGVPPCFAIFNETPLNEITITATRIEPSLVELPNGNLLCAYQNAADDLKCKISTDGGETWGGEITIYSTADVNNSPYLLVNGVGDVLCFFSTDEDGTDDIKVLASGDGGSTWGSKTTVYAGAGIDILANAIKKSNDDILCAFNTDEDGDSDIKVLTSVDDGGTWGSKTTIYAGAGHDAEPSMALIGNDNDIICGFSTDEDGTTNIKSVISADGGGTWGTKRDIYATADTNASPSILYIPSGFFICAFNTDEDGDLDVKRLVSIDIGATWTDLALILDSGGVDVIPRLALLDDGSVKCVLENSGDVVIVDILNVSVPCYYTYLTCKDPENYNRGSKTYSFVTPSGAHVSENRLTYIKKDGVKISPTMISAGKTQSRRGVVTINFDDDIPHPKANADKLVSNDDQGISFWRNLKARNRNYKGRPFLIYQGYMTPTGPVWASNPCFRGVLENWEITGTDVKIKARDLLVGLLDKKIPKATSSDNDLTSTLTIGETTEMIVTDSSEFEDSGTVRIEDEYIPYTSKNDNLNKLLGLTRGAFDSTAVEHAIETRVKQVVVISDSAWTSGQSTDKCMLDLICGHGEIDPLLLRTVDVGRTLNGNIGAAATAIPVDSFQDLVHEGFIRINDEIIYVDGLDEAATDLTLSTVAYRGMYGTTASAHTSGDDVELLQITDEVYFAMAGARYRRKLETSKSVQFWLNELGREALIDNWIDEEGKASFHSWRPPRHNEIVTVITDDANVIRGEINDNEKQRVTRSEVSYNLKEPTKPPSKDPDDFSGFTVRVFTDKESANYYGKSIPAVFFSGWIFRKPEATRLGDRYMITFSDNPALLPLELEQKDGAIRTGSFLNVTVREQMGVDGSPESNVLFYVLEKKLIGNGEKFKVTGLRLNLDRKYPIISPATATHDYDNAVVDQDVYGWVGSTGEWPTGNKNGAANDDGGYMW